MSESKRSHAVIILRINVADIAKKSLVYAGEESNNNVIQTSARQIY